MGSALAWLLFLSIMVVIVGAWMKIANYIGRMLHISDLVEWLIEYFSGGKGRGREEDNGNVAFHDRYIHGYHVDLKDGEIVFDLDGDGETLVFRGVVAHRFSHEIEQSIILDIEEVSIEQFIKVNREEILTGLPYGWPMDVGTVCEFEEVLRTRKKNCYVISASIGLNGWIIGDGYVVNSYT